MSKESQNKKGVEKGDIKEIYGEGDGGSIFKRPVTHSRALTIGIVVGAFFGIVGGIVGTVLFFSGAFAPLKIGLEELMPAQQLKIEKRDQVNVLEEERFDKVTESVKNSIVAVFKKKVSSDKLLDNVYLPTEKLGSGLVLTNDGWVVTAAGVAGDGKDLVVVTADKQILTVEKIILDDYSGVFFLKTSGRGLNTLPLSDTSTLGVGDKTILFDGLGGELAGKVVRVLENNWQNNSSAKSLVRSSSQLSTFLVLDGNLGGNFLGTPAINLAGEAVGILINKDGKQVVVSYGDFKRGMEIVLAGKEKIERVVLGARYLDLSQLTGGGVKIKKGNEVKPLAEGALVTEVVSGTPAFKAKIVANDVILKVGDSEVNGVNTLTRLIQNYKIGESANLTVLSPGSEEEKVVTVNF